MKFYTFLMGLVFCFIIGSIHPAFAGFTIPSDTYRMHEFEDALEEAKSEGWALTFLLTTENMNCPLGERASRAAIKELEEESLIIYVNAGSNDFAKCPKIVQKAFKSKKSGRYIPKTVITDSKVKRIIDIVPYHSDNAIHVDSLRNACKKILEPPSLFQKVKNFF